MKLIRRRQKTGRARSVCATRHLRQRRLAVAHGPQRWRTRRGGSLDARSHKLPVLGTLCCFASIDTTYMPILVPCVAMNSENESIDATVRMRVRQRAGAAGGVSRIDACAHCRQGAASLQLCARCRRTHYCRFLQMFMYTLVLSSVPDSRSYISRECQRAHWKLHKKVCVAAESEREKS